MSNTLLNDEALKEKLLWDLPDFYEKNSQMVDGYEYKFDKVADYVIELLHSQQQAYADTLIGPDIDTAAEMEKVGRLLAPLPIFNNERNK